MYRFVVFAASLKTNCDPRVYLTRARQQALVFSRQRRELELADVHVGRAVAAAAAAVGVPAERHKVIKRALRRSSFTATAGWMMTECSGQTASATPSAR